LASPRAPPWRRHSRLAPLGGVEGVQPLAAQQRASPGRVRGQGVVVVEDPGPYSAVNERRQGRAAGSCSSTAPSWAREQRRSRHSHRVHVFLSRAGAMVGCRTVSSHAHGRQGHRGRTDRPRSRAESPPSARSPIARMSPG
jgi:hypothetical protein